MNKLSLLVVCVAGLAGCALTPAPKSWIVGSPEGILRFHEYPLRVLSVDGSINFGHSVQLEAGRHTVVLQAGNGRNAYRNVQKTVQLTIAPCTRYYYLAERDNDFARDWHLKLKDSEIVAGCDPAEELRKSALAAQARL